VELVVAQIVTLVTAPIIRRIAIRLRIVDRPGSAQDPPRRSRTSAASRSSSVCSWARSTRTGSC
jgi:hypothetical protein